MKKKKMFGLLIAVAAVGVVTPIVGNAMQSTASVKEKQTEKKFSELEDLKKELVDLEKKEMLSTEEEEKYKNLTAEIGNMELECEVFDYKKEVDIRLTTVETAINDMKRDLERGIPKELEEDAVNRITELTKVVEKYNDIMNQGTMDYKDIAVQLDADLNEVYEKIN